MSAAVQLAIAFAALLVSARTRVTVVVGGAHASLPVLWLVAAVVLLVLAGAVLLLIRQGRSEGWLRLRPVVVTT